MRKRPLYYRERHLSRLRPFHLADDTIKVIMGVRHCGKSCLMATVAKELRDGGIPREG